MERDEHARAGLGLLSRFLGAIFLVLLCGLLLLDRALLRANRNQAELDAQSVVLLSESFMSEQMAHLERAVSIVNDDRWPNDSALKMQLERIVRQMPGFTYGRIIGLHGAPEREISNPGSATEPPSFQAVPPSSTPGIVVVPFPSRHALIALVQGFMQRNGTSGRVVQVFLDGDILKERLEKTRTDSREALLIMSGKDTITAFGRPEGSAQARTAGVGVIRLPTGGTWSVTATHALAARSLRWALWTLGVLGVAFLALGLLREQRRALHASTRSLELERLYSDVKRANQAKSEFLANVSHELRTPLNAIVGFVELLRDGFYGDLSPRQVLPVDRIAASATHLRHLVDQVLDIAKIAAGRLEVHAETIVLRPFVLNIASELESLVSEKQLALSLTVGASLPRVRTDPTHLRQILINLIGNAVKYTTAGTVSIRARLTTITEDRRRTGSVVQGTAPRTGMWVALQVVDTGVGIAKADLERIFDEFEQVNAGPRGDSMHRGTGLGLAISRRLARLLGGEITVESELGRGSTFTIWLPVNPADIPRSTTTSPAAGTPVVPGVSA